MTLTVRPMTAADDADAVVSLWTACGLTRPWNDPRADLAVALSSPSSAMLLGFENGSLIGTAMIGFDGHRGWVYYLASLPAAQGRGCGRALMAAAEVWLVERGAPAVRLMVRGDNTAARGFYAALGYAEQDLVVLGRRLDGR